TINKGSCLRHVIESNEREKLRRTTIKSGYIFCTREIATVPELDFHSGSVGCLAESLKAIGIGYLVNLNYNINWRRGCASVQTPNCNGAKLPTVVRTEFSQFPPILPPDVPTVPTPTSGQLGH